MGAPRWVVKDSVYARTLIGTEYDSAEAAIAAVIALSPCYQGYDTTVVRYGDDTTISVYASEDRARTCAKRWGAGDTPDTLILRDGIPSLSPVPGTKGRTGYKVEVIKR